MIPGLALAIAVIPGLAAWLLGRRLLPHREEATLPERLLAHRQRVSLISAAAAAMLIVLAGPHNAWALPVLVLLLLVGSFPARKVVLAETWDLPAYLAHVLGFALGGLGFFALLAATPALIHALGGALVFLAVLCLWAAGSTRVFLFLVRASPLDRPDLLEHLDRVVARSGRPRPRLFRAGPRGGRFANAFALPGWNDSSVLFTEDLLAHFTPGETAAVFAHEVAHLEHIDRRRLARRSLAVALLVALAVFVVPWAAREHPDLAGLVLIAWALAVAVAVPASLAVHRAHEAESDRRAVELGGDPEALVSALVKLTAFARLPRRWALDVERHASHPSLARRIQAIRQAAGTAPQVLASPVVLAGREAGRFVVLEAERAHWLEGAPEDLAGDAVALRLAARRARSFDYGELAELHVDVSKGHASLRAVSTVGEKWTVGLRPEAVAAAQSALDVVDARLKAHEPRRTVLPVLAAAVAGLLLLCGSAAGHALLVAPVSLLALLRSGPVPLAAAGATALSAAILSLARPSALVPRSLLGVLSLLLAGLGGLLAAFLLYRRTPESRGKGALPALLVQACVTAVALAGVLLALTVSHPVLRLHQAAAEAAPAASLLGLGTALLFAPWGMGRLASVLPLAGAALAMVLGSEALVRPSLGGPLAATAPPFREKPLAATRLHEQRLSEAGGELRVSPSGRAFAIRVWGENDEEAPSLIRLGLFGGRTHDLEAEDLRFVDDRHALVLAPDATSRRELRLVEVTSPSESQWCLPVPALVLPQLAVDPATRAWRVAGTTFERHEARVLSGVVGQEGHDEARFPLPPGGPLLAALGRSGGLGVRLDVDMRSIQQLPWPLLLLIAPVYPVESEVFRLTPGGPRSIGSSGLNVRCPPPALDEVFFCLADDGRRTTVFEVDVSGGRLEAKGSLAGKVVPWESGPGGRLYAWSATQGTFIVEVGTHTIRTLPLSGAGATGLAGNSRVLAVLRPEGTSSVVAAYEIQ